ncbi:hypothetical protein B0H12DRAFT_1320573 [Mycena haematopus]|nr:hypothetical protein B0H12DRAFT_1320573 [Mycena haematopus]
MNRTTMDSDKLDWPCALRRTIMLAQLPHLESNPRSKYPSGDLWKDILGLSIIRDLEAATDDEKGTNTTRFVTIDHAGLSGVIFYSAPTRRLSIPDHATVDSVVTALIERNAVQILSFPVASTSFITGQIMKSHLLSDTTICPKAHLSGSGFSLNSRALEALCFALAGGSPIPIRDLSSELKPTPHCADRVLKDRRQAARLLLVMRYRNPIRNRNKDLPTAPRVSTPSTVPEEIKLDELSLNSRNAQEKEALESPDAPESSTLHSNAAILTATKHSLPQALRNRHHANTLSTVPSSMDSQSNEKNKQLRALKRAGAKGKENKVFV